MADAAHADLVVVGAADGIVGNVVGVVRREHGVHADGTPLGAHAILVLVALVAFFGRGHAFGARVWMWIAGLVRANRKRARRSRAAFASVVKQTEAPQWATLAVGKWCRTKANVEMAIGDVGRVGGGPPPGPGVGRGSAGRFLF